jgi:FkbM family methyltransferase
MDTATLIRRAAFAGRRALAARGIEIRRTDSGRRRTMDAVIAHYRRLGLAPTTVIDVGVAAGTPLLYEGFRDAELLLVEPLEEWRGQMEAATAGRRAPTHVTIAAAGAQAGEIEIAVHRAPVCSSMLGQRLGDSDQPRRTVPLQRLDDIAQRAGVRGPYVIKADVEGAELEVLKGAPRLLAETELVLLEVSLFAHIDGAPQFADVVAWMREHGFVVGDFYDGHNRPLDDSLAIIDIAFVQEAGRFRREHAYATAAQADELYRSWGY